MSPIFWFELRYRLKRPATYIYALIFLILGMVIMSTDAVRIGGGYGKVYSNAPHNIHQIISIMGVLGLFIIMAFHAVPVYRDSEYKMDTFLYAYPITQKNYLIGRFLGTFFMCALVFLFLPIGMMAGEGISRLQNPDSGDFGPFSISTYLWPYLVATLPVIFLLGSMFFSLVSLSRKMMYAYIVAISFIVFYSISINLLSNLDNKTLAALLDPFGLMAADRVTEFWSIAEKNTRLVPFESYFLWNRLIWLSLGFAFFGYVLLKFKMTPVAENAKTRKIKELAEEKSPILVAPSRLFQPNYSQLSTFFTLCKLEVRQTVRNVFFLAFLFAIALYTGMDAWYADQSYDTGIHPVTGIMLESASRSLFNILSIVLIIFLAGEIVWRERQVKMEGIYDAFPTANAAVFWSKFVSLLVVPIFLLAVIPLVCIPIQTIKGYYHYEPELYIKTLLLFELPKLWLIASLAFCIQHVVNNKYTGNVAILLYYISFIGLSYIKVEHPLFRYGSNLSYLYSDMNGFGDYVRVIQTYLLHWTFVAFFLLGIAYLFMVRGAESSMKARLRTIRNRFNQSIWTKLGLGIPAIGMLITGFYITKTTYQIDHYQNSKQAEVEAADYEKKFDYLNRSFQPSLHDVKVGADMYPENGDLRLTSTMGYYNPHNKAIDTLWFNFNREGTLVKFDISQGSKLFYEDVSKGIKAFKLDKSLAPGDSFTTQFEMKLAYTGLENESPVKGNGTFFNNSSWPTMGYNDGYKIQDEDKRKEYGLKEIPTLPSQLDSNGLNKSLFDNLNHYLTFEATLSTSPDQIAIAPGYLTKEWMQDGRRYFHYKMDRPISNFYSIISARYATYSEKWNDVDITIYHHPWHTFNVKKMAEAVRHSLDYYTVNFGPYQHKQVRILEFPRYQSFAQSFDNTIPYSEGIGFIANLDEADAIDYVYFVTAHEMAHQWWGHQIMPAAVRGGQFLSETMAEYSALMVMKKQYGIELMGRFLRRELRDYLAGRSREKKKENPLLDIEFQGYAYYNKGSLAMFNIMELLTEEKMNQFLGQFVSQYKFKSQPYPSTHDYYQTMLPFIPAGKQELVDDQLKRITLYKNKISEAKGSKLADGTFEVRIKVTLEKFYADSLGKEIPAVFAQSIQIGLLQEESPKVKADVVLIENRNLKTGEEVILRSKIKAKYASVDPMHTFTDISMEDNTKVIDWK